MNIEIKNRFSGAVIYSGDHDSIKAAMAAALGMKVSLCGADLRSANLCDADLRSADLRSANLCDADLRSADLRGADLRSANLCDADLRSADLRGADLRSADLRGADLRSADLRGADLRGADLCGADLRSARNSELAIAMTRILPAGTLVGWKKAYDNTTRKRCIVELEIPKDARRSHAFGRKCRAERAVVVAIHPASVAVAYSDHDPTFTYRVGESVVPANGFDENWTNECAGGIHFFITREEAEAY